LLRPWREEDLDAYARITSDPEVMRYVIGPLTREQSEEQMARFVRRWDERGFGLWARRAQGVGRVHRLYRPSLPKRLARGCAQHESGVAARPRLLARGLATEGALASLRYGFEEPGQERIISIIHPANLSSRRVAEKVGLTLRGETRWRGVDVVWYAIERPDWEVDGR
jgi:RimJ/RimL family protein N-acetyltransferase